MKKRQIIGLLILLWILGGTSRADTAANPIANSQTNRPAKHTDYSFQALRKVPILSGGRVKPFDSFAREMVLMVTGSRKFKGWDPLDLILSWISLPQSWDKEAFISIGRADVKRVLGLNESQSFFSPKDLFENSYLLQYAEKMSPTPEPGSRPNPRDQELRRVVDRVASVRALVTGRTLTMIPDPKSKTPDHAWQPLDPRNEQEMSSDGGGSGIGSPASQAMATADLIRKKFADVLVAYMGGQKPNFAQMSEDLRTTIIASIPGWETSHESKIAVEVFYHCFRPFLWAWILYLTAVVIWGVGFARNSVKKLPGAGSLQVIAFSFMTLGFGLQTFGIALRCYVAGRPPVTNMYESILWVMYGIFIFAGVLYYFYKKPVVLLAASVLGAVGLIAADAAPAMMDPGMHPLVPVLRSNFWLTIHVLTITLGYAAFALTLGLGNVTLFHVMRSSTEAIKQLNLLTYRAMQIGVVLLAAGTILGGVWADYSWGRFWGWDPKETWALIALLCYVAILHARFTNWIGGFGFAVCSVVGFLSVLMAWYGVNFVLGAGLHSYGFSSGGLPYVLGFVALQLAYVGVAFVVNRKTVKDS